MVLGQATSADIDRILVLCKTLADIDRMLVFCKLGSYKPGEILDPAVMATFGIEQALVSAQLSVRDPQQIDEALLVTIDVYGEVVQPFELRDVLETDREIYTTEVQLVSVR